jgi:Domain of unknown function (DUF4386)
MQIGASMDAGVSGAGPGVGPFERRSGDRHGFDRWRGLLRVGGWAAFGSVALIFVQVWIYVQWPPPETVEDFYTLFTENPFLGLLSLDLLYIVNNVIVLLVYLALFAVLRPTHPAAVTIALLLGSVGMAAYMASNVGFEMLALADAYAAADGAGRVALLGAGEVLLASFEGTAFNIYYVLSMVALLLFAGSMLRSRDFSRAAGGWGLAAALLMIVPSTAGALGMVFALASLGPWVVFALLTGRRLLNLSARRVSVEGRTSPTGG